MFVIRLDADDWTTGEQGDEVIEQPGLEQIEAALERLDGERYSLVVLGADESTYMGIGGGSGDKYVVFVSYDDQEFYSLWDDELGVAEDGVIILNIGGRKDEYPAQQCVGREAMLRAAKRFAADGTREPTLTWRRQEEDDEDEGGYAEALPDTGG